MDVNHTVLLSAVFFLLLNSPGHLLRLYASSLDNHHHGNVIYHTKLLLCQQCLFYLYAVRGSSNFFVYLTNPIFREYFGIMKVKLWRLVQQKLLGQSYAVRYSINSLPLYTLSTAFYDSEASGQQEAV